MYPKDTEKWKQFTTSHSIYSKRRKLLCIPKILKNESNSQQLVLKSYLLICCCVSQRYWKMKAIHNESSRLDYRWKVVVYPKDTEKWKQFTTKRRSLWCSEKLLCIPKILKNESNSQQITQMSMPAMCCCVSQRYWKMKAIHNTTSYQSAILSVVVYPKDTEKWKQFTTELEAEKQMELLLCIPKILKNESNSQRFQKRLSNN